MNDPDDPNLKKKIDQKIDEFVAATFPASDPPNWSALRDYINKEEEKMEQAPPSTSEIESECR